MQNEALKDTLMILTQEISSYAAVMRAAGKSSKKADTFLLDMLAAYDETAEPAEIEDLIAKAEKVRNELTSSYIH